MSPVVSTLLINSLYTSVNQHNKEFQQGYLFTYNPFGCLLFSTYFLFWILTFFFLPLVFPGWIVMLNLLLFIFTARLTLAVSQTSLSVKKTSAVCYGQCCPFLFLEKSNSIKSQHFFQLIWTMIFLPQIPFKKWLQASSASGIQLDFQHCVWIWLFSSNMY